MPNSITFSEGQRLARELAPVLARIPRALPQHAQTLLARAQRAGASKVDRSPDGYGAMVVHIRRYVDIPIGRRPRAHDYCQAHGISETSFASGLTKEIRTRRDPAALAERELYESAARTFARQHPCATRAQRRAFLAAHNLDHRTFLHALRRVEILAAHEAREHTQKGHAA